MSDQDSRRSTHPDNPTHAPTVVPDTRNDPFGNSISAGGPNDPTPHTDSNAFPGFVLLKVLGKGGMGIVYKARQFTLEVRCQNSSKVSPPETVANLRSCDAAE